MGTPTNYKIVEEIVKFQKEQSVWITVPKGSSLNGDSHVLSKIHFHKSSHFTKIIPQILCQMYFHYFRKETFYQLRILEWMVDLFQSFIVFIRGYEG